MNKFWAKVKFKTEKSAEHLISAFFQDFDPANSITIRNNEAKLELNFKQPPMAIIDAINQCEIVELNYGKNLKEYNEDEAIQVKTEKNFEKKNAEGESSKHTEQVNVENENSEQIEQANAEPAKKVKPVSISELDEIAKKATSFDHFAELLAEWLEMDTRQEFFKNLVIVSAEVDKIKWEELEKALKYKNIVYSSWDKSWSGRQLSKKLKEDSVTIISFLKTVRHYKEYSFGQAAEEPSNKENSTEPVAEEPSNKENSTEPVAEETTQNVTKNAEEPNESNVLKPRLKMECMPEIKDFEETLASVNKAQPVEDRVRYVLMAMGLNELPNKEQEQTIKIASLAVKKEIIDFNTIFEEANIPVGQRKDPQLRFAKFVNDFVQKYESGKKIKLLTFLSELQKIIMFEDEIKNL